MSFPPVRVDRLWNSAAPRFAPPARKRLARLATCLVWFAAAQAQAQSVTGISATANCDAVTGVSLSGAGSVTISDGNGTLIAWVSSSAGLFIPFEQPNNNTQWTVNGSTTIIPSNFASQCAPPSPTISVGTFNARIMQGGWVRLRVAAIP
jgi:hypothetical protein